MGSTGLAAFVCSAALHAALIRGVVVEDSSGHPVARSVVMAQPVAGTRGAAQSVRTDANGQFEFPALPAGAYLVVASHRGFAPVQYGQKRWQASGVPVVLEDAGSAALSLRLERFGSIAGAVLDQNDVGLPDHDVVAYRNSRPPVLAARARTDDRGMYYLWGLEPGSYLVRTVGKEYDEGSYLPTFSRQTARLEEAAAVEVQLDAVTERVDVRPFPGRLVTVAGHAVIRPPAAVSVTLVSETGAQTVRADRRGGFRFPPVAPGPYELYAAAFGGRNSAPTAAYRRIRVERDRDEFNLSPGPLPVLNVELVDDKGQAVDAAAAQVFVRRKDLAGDGRPEILRPPQPLAPGRWDVALASGRSYYVAGFIGPKQERGADRADGWNEIDLAGSGRVQFVLAPHPATLHGVLREAGKPVAGAPVFLEAYDPPSHRRLGELRSTRTDMQGQYDFYGLAPGDYRLLGTFEFLAPDAAALDAAQPWAAKLGEGQDQACDLDLYVIR